MMKKLYEKNRLTFALLWIAGYVVAASIADSLSLQIDIEKSITAPLLLGGSLFLYLWLNRHGLRTEYGLCRFEGNAGRFLYFLPLAVLVTLNLWNGVAFSLSPLETALYCLSMLCVGFLEEVIFRGFLFKALCANGIKQAFVISSLTFGIGHVVNLLNGADLLPTLLQIVNAVAIGFLFTLLFYKGKSLWPCILTHGLFNSMSAFGKEPSTVGQLLLAAVTCALSLGYAAWILAKTKKVNM